MVRPVLFWLRVVMLVIIKLGFGIIWSRVVVFMAARVGMVEGELSIIFKYFS